MVDCLREHKSVQALVQACRHSCRFIAGAACPLKTRKDGGSPGRWGTPPATLRDSPHAHISRSYNFRLLQSAKQFLYTVSYLILRHLQQRLSMVETACPPSVGPRNLRRHPWIWVPCRTTRFIYTRNTITWGQCWQCRRMYSRAVVCQSLARAQGPQSQLDGTGVDQTAALAVYSCMEPGPCACKPALTVRGHHAKWLPVQRARPKGTSPG